MPNYILDVTECSEISVFEIYIVSCFCKYSRLEKKTYTLVISNTDITKNFLTSKTKVVAVMALVVSSFKTLLVLCIYSRL